MKKLAVRFSLLTFFIMQFIALRAWAGEGLDVPEALEQDVSIRGLTGIQLFFARLYNDNLLLFAIVCTILMAVIGILISFVTDLALKMMGLETEKISHEE
jgi:ABC-type phosphate/phosphonate transport system permease subunit